MSRRVGLVILASCMLASGAASLAFQLVWTRALQLVFGSTTWATSTVLLVYMCGLGAGAWWGGRQIFDRQARCVAMYGALELGVAGYALAVPWLIDAMAGLGALASDDSGQGQLLALRLVLATIVLLPPTFFMGASLPILVGSIPRAGHQVGRITGLLYGLNTLGAVIGVVLTTFVSFPLLGMSGTNGLGAGIDGLVGLTALAWARFGLRGAAEDELRAGASQMSEPEHGVSNARAAIICWLYGCIGFVALLFEVAWTRALAVVLGSSMYGFSATLIAFLGGIGIGSLLARWHADRVRDAGRTMAGLAIALAVSAALTILVLPRLPDVFLWLVRPEDMAGVDRVRIMATRVFVAATVMFVPATILGMMFPVATAWVHSQAARAAHSVSRMYLANCIGAAIGAVLSGFVLLAYLGLVGTMTLGIVITVFVAATAASLDASRNQRSLAAMVAVLVAAAAIAWPLPFDLHAFTRGVFKNPVEALEFGVAFEPVDGMPEHELLFHADGVNATVSVHRSGGVTALRVNGKADASSHSDLPTQVMLGQIPLLFGPAVRRVAVIGYASGVTVGSVARNEGVQIIDAIEIEPEIIAASRYFDAWSQAPLDDPRVRVVVDDARGYFSGRRQPYDVIISEPSNPWCSGASSLFTREFFATAHAALAPGGRMLQWVQLYSIEPESLRSILAALRDSFGHVYGFVHRRGDPDLLLLASDRALVPEDLPRWSELAPAIRDDLRRIGNFNTADLWTMLRLLPADIDALLGPQAAVNTDDDMLVELASPLSLNADTLDANWLALDRRTDGLLPLFAGGGETLPAETLGALALAYAETRADVVVAKTIMARAAHRGPSGHALAAAVVLDAWVGSDEPRSPQDHLRALDLALTLAAHAPELVRIKASVLAGIGDHAGVRALLDPVIEAAGEDPEIDPRLRVLHATSLAGLGDHELARAAILQILSTSHSQLEPQLWRKLARWSLQAGDLAQAAAVLDVHLHQREPEWLEGWQLLAQVQAKRGDVEAARRADEAAQFTVRNRAARLVRAARLSRWRGDDPQAAQDLIESARRLDPGHPLVSEELSALGVDSVR